MIRRVTTILALAFLLLAPTAGWCDLAPYSQDFEGLKTQDPEALAADGWLIYGNVFSPDGMTWYYGYGPFPAPNGGEAFSAIAFKEGGDEQGMKQLSVYSDYANVDHAAGNLIEANVFHEQMIGAVDVGSTWSLEFDAKRGNIEGGTAAHAFIKTLDPNADYALTNFLVIDMTGVPDTWGSYSLSIDIEAGLAGQILQFGFMNTATYYEGSGVFYDNIELGRESLAVSLDINPGICPNLTSRKAVGDFVVALVDNGVVDLGQIDPASLRLEGVAPFDSAYADVATPFDGDVCGCNDLGPDGTVDLTLTFNAEEVIAAVGLTKPGDYVLTLTGALLDGTPIKGQDCFVIVTGP